ncbi:MAG: hypothetical protein WC340_14570 [Kiritimatiellia bacterium]
MRDLAKILEDLVVCRVAVSIAALLSCAAALPLCAAPVTNPNILERIRLYTAPDPSAAGGIQGRIAFPRKPIEQILAMPPDEPKYVYMGQVSGEDKQSFSFANLPMAKYNLFIIYEDEFFEGLELSREPDTLTSKDREGITKIVNASDPFFNNKVIHRIEGTTGRGNFARCVVTQSRDQSAPGEVVAGEGFGVTMEKHLGRRTYKLIWLKHVGVGWQVVQKRDLYPVTVNLKELKPKHNYSRKLSSIRVTNKVKDLGEIDFSKLK